MSDIIRWTAAELADKLTAGDISSREATQAHLDRIGAVDGDVHAFLHVNEGALAAADAVDAQRAAGEKLGPLAGVPLAIKDVLVTNDQPTTSGSKILEGYMSPFDATVVARSRAAGLIPLGKTNMELCDIAVVRRPIEAARFDSVVVGLERRLVVFAADDPGWSRRRQVSMAEISDRTVLIDRRSGSTSVELWSSSDHAPRFVESFDVDSWLDAIAAGRGIGTTAEATAHHHPRPGVTYRPVKDGPRIPVRLAWWRDHQPTGLADLVDAATQLYAGG